jgi:hypothetical protein
MLMKKIRKNKIFSTKPSCRYCTGFEAWESIVVTTYFFLTRSFRSSRWGKPPPYTCSHLPFDCAQGKLYPVSRSSPVESALNGVNPRRKVNFSVLSVPSFDCAQDGVCGYITGMIQNVSKSIKKLQKVSKNYKKLLKNLKKSQKNRKKQQIFRLRFGALKMTNEKSQGEGLPQFYILQFDFCIKRAPRPADSRVSHIS